jgi:hypothetical protein
MPFRLFILLSKKKRVADALAASFSLSLAVGLV